MDRKDGPDHVPERAKGWGDAGCQRRTSKRSCSKFSTCHKTSGVLIRGCHSFKNPSQISIGELPSFLHTGKAAKEFRCSQPGDVMHGDASYTNSYSVYFLLHTTRGKTDPRRTCMHTEHTLIASVTEFVEVIIL